jgi:translation initiation factor 1
LFFRQKFQLIRTGATTSSTNSPTIYDENAAAFCYYHSSKHIKREPDFSTDKAYGEKSMKKTPSDDARLVYSSELGRICPGCGKPKAGCVCHKETARPTGDGIVRIQRESKGRGGKTVTVITGIPLDETALKNLVGELKRRCGTGGTLKDGNIEIQGDHRDLLVAELEKRGYKVKRAGG